MNIRSHIRLSAWNTSKKSDDILMTIPLNSWQYQWETLAQKEMITVCDRRNASIITSRSFLFSLISTMLECFYNANIPNHFYPVFQSNKATLLHRMYKHQSSQLSRLLPPGHTCCKGAYVPATCADSQWCPLALHSFGSSTGFFASPSLMGCSLSCKYFSTRISNT